MLSILSPAKTQIYDDDLSCRRDSSILFPKEVQTLVQTLASLSQAALARKLDVSAKLAALNYERFQKFSKTFSAKNSRQALLAYRGDVYEGLHVHEFTEADFRFAQDHLRILSGLYGLLRPLDRIQPYRLEMANRVAVGKQKDLYAYWSEKLSISLAAELAVQKSPVLVNLASKEYWSVLDFSALNAPVITCEFKEEKGGKLRILGLFAKRARGQMASWIIRERIDAPEELKDFRVGGYQFQKKLSTESTYVFTRPQPSVAAR